MVLGIEALHELVSKNSLVEGLCDREINNPEGAGFDLRLGEAYEISGDGYLGKEERNTPDAKLIESHKEGENKSFVFEPGRYYLVKTIEKVKLPTDIIGVIFSRTTVFRSGLGLFNGIVQPGYEGELTFGLGNLGGSRIVIEMGARIVHITFHQVLGSGNQYRGQWQGGRVSTGGKETQI